LYMKHYGDNHQTWYYVGLTLAVQDKILFK
jgi:hypothetical protein